MRVSTALTAGAAAILLSACSSAPQSTAGGLVPATVTASHSGPAHSLAHRLQLPPHVLYVADPDDSGIAVFQYGTWAKVGEITDGIANPNGVWVDRARRLYVTNSAGPTITEYDSSGNLIYTYYYHMNTPLSVTTDAHGNVYDGDAGVINEYAQGSNVVKASCPIPQRAFGVATDKKGDVFVAAENYTGLGISILVFPYGLTHFGCGHFSLPFGFQLGGSDSQYGMAFDKQNNLIVSDIGRGVVDVIAPPYQSITGTLGSGWAAPIDVTINKAGTRAYVTQAFPAESVGVVTYPGGSPIVTIDYQYGLNGFVTSAVESNNYVP